MFSGAMGRCPNSSRSVWQKGEASGEDHDLHLGESGVRMHGIAVATPCSRVLPALGGEWGSE